MHPATRNAAVSTCLSICFALAACSNGAAPGSDAPAPAAASGSQVAAPPSVATSRQIMLGLVVPAADVVWSVATAEPADDAAWEKVQASAVMTTEAGGLMMTGVRVVDQAEWLTYAKAMADAATAAAAAAAEKNVDKLSDTGNTLYETCDACHAKYMAARQGQ